MVFSKVLLLSFLCILSLISGMHPTKGKNPKRNNSPRKNDTVPLQTTGTKNSIPAPEFSSEDYAAFKSACSLGVAPIISEKLRLGIDPFIDNCILFRVSPHFPLITSELLFAHLTMEQEEELKIHAEELVSIAAKTKRFDLLSLYSEYLNIFGDIIQANREMFYFAIRINLYKKKYSLGLSAKTFKAHGLILSFITYDSYTKLEKLVQNGTPKNLDPFLIMDRVIGLRRLNALGVLMENKVIDTTFDGNFPAKMACLTGWLQGFNCLVKHSSVSEKFPPFLSFKFACFFGCYEFGLNLIRQTFPELLSSSPSESFNLFKLALIIAIDNDDPMVTLNFMSGLVTDVQIIRRLVSVAAARGAVRVVAAWLQLLEPEMLEPEYMEMVCKLLARYHPAEVIQTALADLPVPISQLKRTEETDKEIEKTPQNNRRIDI